MVRDARRVHREDIISIGQRDPAFLQAIQSLQQQSAQSQTGIADLVGRADPEVFDRTFLVESDDVPVATDEPFTLPTPWQGLPRMAVTINLNYVWDDAAEEWTRQNPSTGGSAWTTAAEGTEDVLSGFSGVTIDTGLSGSDRLFYPVVSFPEPGDLPNQINFISPDYDGGTVDAVRYKLGYVPSSDTWFLDLSQETGNTLTIRWTVLEFTG